MCAIVSHAVLGMPKNLPVDKAALKVAFCNGLPLSDLATKFNIKLSAIRQMAVRGKWQAAKTSNAELVSQVVADAGIKHVNAVASQVQNRLAELATFKFAEAVNKLDAEGYVRSLNTLDLIARRAYKLDEEQKRGQTLVSISVNGVNAESKLDQLDQLDCMTLANVSEVESVKKSDTAS